MNKGIVENIYLQKNIDKIQYYSIEERKTLIKISNEFEKCKDNYKSSNSSLIMNNLNYLNTNIERLYVKRQTYQNVLKNVITQYKSLSNQVIKSFGEGEYHG